MNRTAILAAAILAIAVPACAQTASAPPAVSPPAAASPAAAPRWSVDTKMSALVADPQAAAVVAAFFEKRRIAAGQPKMSDEESAGLMQMIGDLTPRELSNFPQANLDEEALEELNQALAAVPATPAT